MEEVTAATHELGKMADDLRDQVATFRLDDKGADEHSLRALPASAAPVQEEVGASAENAEHAA